MQSPMLMFGMFVLALLCTWTLRHRRKYPNVSPPGPKPRWFVGNKINPHLTWMQYTELAKLHGPVMRLQSYGNQFIVLSSERVAVELLEKRSNIFSDRPRNLMLELTGWSDTFGFRPYSDKWRKHRRMFHQGFRQEAMDRWHPLLLKNLHNTLQFMIKDPSNFERHYRMLTASFIMAAIYGYDVKGPDDHFISIVEDSLLTLQNAVVYPGATSIISLRLLQYMPAWFPKTSLKKLTELGMFRTMEMLEVPFAFAKKSMASNLGKPCLVVDLLESHQAEQHSQADETDIKEMAGTVYAAAADTSASALLNFTAAMALHPHVAKRAQDEIDSLLGGLRLPTFGDRPHLPYVEAVYRELMRWRPPAPLGIPHAAIADSLYQGYLIPKGTPVVTNIWAMTRDESRYPDPDTFRPERFVDVNGNINEDDTILAFGFGRRVCVGRHLASSTIWGFIATSLAVFDFSLVQDEEGRGIPIDLDDGTDGLISYPKPFKCSIKPRSIEAELLVRDHSVA